jgi:predicted RNA binding protein YcfA (HicA-like mRNA interferase family)
MKVREVLTILRKDSWVLDRIRGSHRQLRHSVKKGTVTVAGHMNEDINPKTLKSIRRQAQLED